MIMEISPVLWDFASEDQADKAVARLKPMIEAAEASNQAGENAVVKAIHAFDNIDKIIKALTPFRAALYALDGWNAELTYRIPDDDSLGSIPESNCSPRFIIRAGHIRSLAAALIAARGEK